MDGTVRSTTAPSQSGPGSNDSKRLIHSYQRSRIAASSSDAVSSHIQDTPFARCTVGGVWILSKESGRRISKTAGWVDIYIYIYIYIKETENLSSEPRTGKFSCY